MLSQTGYDYARSHRILEICAITGLLTCWVWLAWRIVFNATGVGDWAVVGASMLFGYVFADFSSGFVHWMADRYGTIDTPVAGPNFVRPFREHHEDPKGITRHDFIETNGNNSIVCLPVALVVLLGVANDPGSALILALFGFTLSLCLSVFDTNQFHKWAHTDDPPPAVRTLQRLGLILDIDHHQIHHTPPFETYYCITTGWLNWLLFKLHFFPITEWLVERTLGIRAGVHGPYASKKAPSLSEI